MKFQDNSGQAAQYLRLAIPKMIKHQIIPNPLNYTLWYSYFSKTHPKLNIELDQALKSFGTCPQIVSEQLFMSHIVKLDQQGDIENVQQALLDLVSDLSKNIDQTSMSSAGYSDTLKLKIDQLNDPQHAGDVNPLLRELADSAQAICDNNEQFQQQIEAAKKEIDALKIELQNTKTQASTDHLTGLFNRRVFDAIFAEFSLNNGDQNISLIMMDIDKFKVFNDTHGHSMGDQILKHVGTLLKQECIAPNVPVRMGGEEFAILCPSSGLDSARELAQKLCDKLARISFVNHKSGLKIPPLTASFGVAQRQLNESIGNIVERADSALYRAKDSGRNQVVSAN